MELNFKELGLKAGLEVHQQLDTGKLFCRCPSSLREENPDTVFKRKLRAVASELGEYDPAALEQYKKNLTYVYQAYSDSNCLIETDEEPPMEIDSDALKLVLQVALMSKSKIMDELVVMRKAVIDGSNTSGFQRTALVGIGGKLQLKEKEVGVLSIAIEEDAARIIQRKGSEVVYRLDRLGIPLIELATAPDIRTPEEAQECALTIGELFRRTGKAKRGLGTIRQDLNVSIKEGTRNEIKGVQELGMIKEYVKREAQRQLGLIEAMKELKKRGLHEKDLESKHTNLDKVFEDTECEIIRKKAKEQGVFGVKLEKFSGVIGKELQPERRIGSEFADYVKTKSGLKGLFHSDELPKYGISEAEVKEVAKRLGCSEKDAFVLVVAGKEKAEAALNAVIGRAKQCLRGVPGETRNALEEGNTSYLRPLPGAARMYPETDLETIKVSEAMLAELKKSLPKSGKERRDFYITKYSLNPALAEKMKLSNFAPLFEELTGKGFDPTTAAVLLLEGLVQLKRNGVNVENISGEMIEEVLKAAQGDALTKEVLLEALAVWAKQPGEELSEVIEGLGLKKAGKGEAEAIISKLVEKNKKMIEEKGEFAGKALMGEAMRELKGKASGKEVNELLAKEIKKVLGK